LLPHGAKVLIELGLQERLDEIAIRTREIKYLTRYGQEIYADPRGLHAGFAWPQYSIHRGELQFILLDAVKTTIGADCLKMGHHLRAFEQTEANVTAHFIDKVTGTAPGSATGDMLIAADGIHSAARRQIAPDEGPARFSGVMMWRGAAETAPILDGETMFIAGNFQDKVVVYPISPAYRQQGKSLTNWVAEIRTGGDTAPEIEDWNREGDVSEFIDTYKKWDFGFVNVPDIFRATKRILRFPMVDRDPLPRWSFGRMTLMGDAAHPMYPRGSNGAGQAILDARTLTGHLKRLDDPAAALEAYQADRLEPTSKVVLTNRTNPPDAILREVYERTGDKPFRHIDDVIGRAELERIAEAYKQVAGFQRESLAKRGSLV
jgi:2-polyprenyl-6-methoxyphenol hydroxylase-like FAD-dependent oxidoreductase